MANIRSLLAANDLPRFDKRAILRAIIGFNDSKLFSYDEIELTMLQIQDYNNYVSRRQAGEPLAYILGQKEFYSREFSVTPATLIPRPETELLVDMVIKHAKHGAKMLDLGTGSGCIAITCKLERPDLQILACDKYLPALAIAKANAQKLKAQIELKQSDWFNNLTDKFDLIVSNPPYIKANDQHLLELTYEPQQALTDFADGLTHIRKIISSARHYLKVDGLLLIEHGYNQGQIIRDIYLQEKFSRVESIYDYAALERITWGTLVFNS